MEYKKNDSSYGYHQGELYPLMGGVNDLSLRLIDDTVVAYRVGIAKALGDDPITALVLSQLLHWSKTDVVVKRQGWFYKTEEEFYQETAVTKERQRTARAKLQKLGILQIKQIGMPRKNWYRIEYEMLVSVLTSKIGKLEPYIRENESIIPEDVEPDFKKWEKPTTSSRENPLHSYTENTTESTFLKNHKNDSLASQSFEKNENEEGQEDDWAYEDSEDTVTPRRVAKRKFPTKNGKEIVMEVASDYEADGWSPKDRLALKRKIEKSLGLGRSNRWTQMLYGSLWDFKKAFRFYEKYEYVGDVAPAEVARMLSDLYEAGETRETIRDMLRAYFESEKAKSIAITPTAAFSSHTYNSWKQGKLVPPKVEKRNFWE